MKRKLSKTTCKNCGRIFEHRADHPNMYCSRQCAGIARRHNISCKFCGQMVNKSRNLYCSVKCFMKERTQRSITTLLCDECGVLFSRHQCHIHKINNFCSNECHRIWQIGKNNPKSEVIGTEKIRKDSSGRKRVWIKIDHPDVWMQRARFLWTIKYWDKGIPKGMIIHHKDGDTSYDSICNLACVTRKWHINHHRKELEAGKLK